MAELKPCPFCGYKRIEILADDNEHLYYGMEALRKVLENWRDAHADVDDEQGCGLLEDVIWEVSAQPAADVAPVVRCKDCRKFKTYACREEVLT